MNVRRLMVAACTALGVLASSGCLNPIYCGDPDGNQRCSDVGGVCQPVDGGRSICVVDAGVVSLDDASVDGGRDASVQDVDAGVDGGTDAGRSHCAVVCSGIEQCRADFDGGTCGFVPFELRVLSPSPSLVVGKGAPVSLQIASSDGGGLPNQIPWDAGNLGTGFLSADSGYLTLISSGTSDQSVSVTIGWPDAGTVAYFRVDGTAPTLGYRLQVPDSGQFQRDDIVPLIVIANEDLSDASVEIHGFTSTGAPSLTGVKMMRSSSGICANAAMIPDAQGCFIADFSQPELSALEGQFAVDVSGTDMYGNSGAATRGTEQVTRVRWVASGLPGGGAVQSIAVGTKGSVFVGTGGPIAGSVLRLSSSDGTIYSSTVLGDVQSIAISNSTEEIPFVAFNDSVQDRGGIGSIASDGGLELGSCFGDPGSRTYSGIALLDAGTTTRAIGSLNASTTGVSKYLAYRRGGCPVSIEESGLDSERASSSSRVANAHNVLVSAGQAAFLTRPPGMFAQMRFVTALTGSIPQFGTPIALLNLNAASLSGQSLLAPSTFLVGAERDGTTNQLFALSPDAGVFASGNLAASMDTGLPAVGYSDAGLRAYVGRETKLVLFDPIQLQSSATTIFDAPNDSFRLSPVLGKAQSSQSIGYGVSQKGLIVAFDQNAGGVIWSGKPSSITTSTTAQPSFDCNRLHPETNTGILLIGTAGGQVLAIVVDSPALLDSVGSWPKYQRSSGNAGNDDYAHFPTNWTCP